METVDFSGIIVLYNLVIGILLMLASEKIAVYAGHLNTGRHEQIARFTRVSILAFGSCVSALSAFIYVAFHILKIGV